MDRWLLWQLPSTGRALEYLKITYGWSLMVIVVFTTLLYRYLDARADGRLDEGIDPVWLPRRAPESAAPSSLAP
jgi:arabinofuranan 3-O-arabinosyltransferase